MHIKKLNQEIFLLLIIATLLFSSVIYGKQENPNTPELTFKISLSDQKQLDSVYIVLYPSNFGVTVPFYNRPRYDFITSDSVFSFPVKKGYYSLRVFAYGYKPIFGNLNVQYDSTKIITEIELYPIATNKNPTSVRIIGKFCGWDSRGGKDLTKYGDVWKLDDTSMLKIGDKYQLAVLASICDLNNPKYTPNKRGGDFYSIYTGADIVYKPSLYVGAPRQRSTVKYSGDKAQIEYIEFLSDRRKFENQKYKLKERNKEEWVRKFKILDNELLKLERKYYSRYEQKFLHYRINFLYRFHPYYWEIRPLWENSAEEHEFEKLYKSEVFRDYFNRMLEAAKKIDPKSEFIESLSFARLMNFDEALKYAPELLSGHKFREVNNDNLEAYFTNYTLKIEKEGVPGYEGAHILWMVARSFFKLKKHDKVKEVIHLLATKYPDSYYIRDRLIARMYNAIWLKVGDIAPDFVVKKSNDNNIRLSDYCGKYVFLYFWSLGCYFCYAEIPNVEELFRTFKEKNFEVIGLHEGSENESEWTADFFDIEFPNYHADKNLIEKFGIVHWPSTFLIDPNGKIIALDLRGSKLVERVTQKIENPDIEKQFFVKE